MDNDLVRRATATLGLLLLTNAALLVGLIGTVRDTDQMAGFGFVAAGVTCFAAVAMWLSKPPA